MIFQLSSITLLAALTTAATAQTTTPKPATGTKPATSAAHRPASPATTGVTTPPNIPKVVGIPKTLYAVRYVDALVGTGPLAQSSVIGTSMADSKIQWYTVKYTGWLTNGTKFDSSYDHPGGEPFTFPQGAHRVIPGWDTGFEGMHLGGKRRLFIPYQLAYGEAGRPGIPPKSDLIFDIELVSISDAPPAPKAPPTPPTNPGAAPADPKTPPDKPATDPATKPAAPQPTNPGKPDTTPNPQGR
jgi:peptidylprolyl isomerase